MPDAPEPDDPTDPSAGVRPALRAIRRRRQRTVVAAIAAAMAIAGFGVGAALAVNGTGDKDPDSANTRRHASPSTTTTASSDPAACRSPLTGDDPLRLWIAGDSLAGSLGPSLGEESGATGVVQPFFDSRVSSGLSMPTFFNWPKHATTEIARLNPEVVVFIIGANDWMAPRQAGEAWKAEYAREVEEMLGVLEAGGRRVYWIGSPPMEEKRKDEGVRAVNAVMHEVIARHDRATYIDAYALFAGPDGDFVPSLTLPTGDKVRVRADDGVHFTPEGGDVLAAKVFGALDGWCSTTEQAVPGRPKKAIETEGSSQVPGTRRRTSSTTVTTAAPGTAPPQTAAPTTTTTTTSTPASTSSTPSSSTPSCSLPPPLC